MDNLKRQIGIKIRTARLISGLSQEALAERIEKTPETISNIERGHVLVGLETLQRIAAVLKIPLRDFFDGEQPSRKVEPRRAALESRLVAASSQLSMERLRLLVGVATLFKKEK